MTPRQSRRSLVLALAIPALAGCSSRRISLDDLRPATPPTPSAPPNPDEPLVRELVARIRGLAATATGPWRDLHLTQLRALGHRDPVRAASGGPVGLVSAPAERRLRHELLHACGAAHSPELARLLASMAAGIDQLLRSAA